MDNRQTKCEKTVTAYVSFYQNLSPQKLEGLNELLSDDVHFIDPFNDTKGRDQVIAILQKKCLRMLTIQIL